MARNFKVKVTAHLNLSGKKAVPNQSKSLLLGRAPSPKHQDRSDRAITGPEQA